MEPQNRVGVARLTDLAMKGVDLQTLRTLMLQKCLSGEEREGALMDLSVIDQLRGDHEKGRAWQAQAMQGCTLFRTDRGETAAPRRLLVFAQPADAGDNTPIEFLVRSGEFEILTYYLTAEQTPAEGIALPDHDVAFCAAPVDGERATDFSARVEGLTRNAGTRLLNSFASSGRLDRRTLQERLPDLPGLRLARTEICAREELEETPAATLEPIGQYPFVIRPVGSHAGRGLERVDSAGALAGYLARHPEDVFYVSEFIDYSAARDGLFRKVRMVFIDGEPFPCHLAISDRWDLWYVNAEMEGSEAKRQEEAEFLDGFDTAFGARHRACFDALVQAVGLDYFGIDCSEDRDGNLVVFEADNSLIVHDLDCPTTFPYKTRHMRRLFAGFEAMLTAACRSA